MMLVIGVLLGFSAAAIIAGWVWLCLEPGNDHPLSGEEIRQRCGETWEEAA